MVITLPVLEIIQNLKGNSQMTGKLPDGSFQNLGITGQSCTQVHCSLKRGSRLESVDFQGVGGCQPFVPCISPEQFGPLPFSKPQVRLGQTIQHVTYCLGP